MKDHSSTLPLRSDDAGHRVEETIESYFRLAPLMADHKEAVQDTKGDRGHREEVHRRNGVAMIS